MTHTHLDEDWRFLNPSLPGWYAILKSWHPQAGTFIGVAWWDGSWEWPGKSAITGNAGPFDTEAEAQAWAAAHDPE